ncbi:hypothetical protein RSAG8_00543, partial [Rhizoctonia solani AG-8 WAC10335]
MSSQNNSPNPAAKKDLPAGDGPSKEGKSKAQIRAENRERQDKQRAAKAASTTNKNPGGGNAEAGSNKKVTESKPKQKQPAAQRPDDSSGRRGATAQAPATEAPSMAADVEDKIRDLRIFSHFGARGHLGQKIRLKGSSREIHPSIVRLGLLFAEYKITGANARCISALTAFKSVIADYVTPSNNTLSRHIMTYLSPQISYLTSARPMSVSLGNAIRSLKLQISQIDIDLPEHAAKTELYARIDQYMQERILAADVAISTFGLAKTELYARIDQYMQERILAADVAISTFGLAKIHDGDVVLTYAKWV